MYNYSMAKIIKETFIVLIGNFILAVAVGLFLLPNDILTGGIAGVAVLMSPFISIDTSVIVMFLSVGLLLVGWIFLGTKFMLTTCLSSIIYPFFLMIIERVIVPSNIDPLLASVYGGLLGGAGVGMVIKMGSSTGGMDIPPIIINKYTGFDLSKAVMIFDALTVGFGLMIYGLEQVLIGLISVYLTAFAISKILTYGGVRAKRVEIISDSFVLINERINHELERGTTIINSKGGYTNELKNVILVVVSEKEYQHLINIINEIDKEAFIIVSDATDVHGEGFSEIVRI